VSLLIGPLRDLILLNQSESRHPDDLYKNGIQRSSFVPAVELLKSRFEITDLDSGTGKFFVLSLLNLFN
jgi:protein AFG1